MNDSGAPMQCKDNGVWKGYIEKYPELSPSKQAALDAHIERDGCSECKSARDSLMSAMHALTTGAPVIKKQRYKRYVQRAEAAKPAIVANVMARIQQIERASADEERRSRVTAFPTERAANRNTRPGLVPGARLQPQRIASVITPFREFVAHSLAPFRRIPMKWVIAMLTVFSLLIAWVTARERFNRLNHKKTSKQRMKVRRAMIAALLSLFIGSILATCTVATAVLHSMIIQETTTWWHLALVTGSTATLACGGLFVGTLSTAYLALKGNGWNLGDLGNQLFIDGKHVTRSRQLDATVQSFLGIPDYQSAFALSYRAPQTDQHDRTHADDQRESDLAERIARLAANLRRISSSTTAPWQVTWQQFQEAWADAFAADARPPNALRAGQRVVTWRDRDRIDVPRESSLAEYAKRVFLSDTDLLPSDIVVCQWAESSRGSPGVIVCASGIPIEWTTRRSYQLERRKVVGQNSVEPGRGTPRLSQREIARLKQQQARQGSSKSTPKSKRAAHERTRGAMPPSSDKLSKQGHRTAAPRRTAGSFLARWGTRAEGRIKRGLPVIAAVIAASYQLPDLI